MIKHTILGLLFLVSLYSHGKSVTDVDQLIKNRQYLSAWNFLDEVQNKENAADVHLKKIELSLKYFTKTYSHQLFAFTNLKPNQNLVALRREAEDKMVQMFPYKIDQILDSLQKIYPTDYRLKKAQGDLYYDISILYGKDWIIPQQEVIRRMYEGYTTAEEHGITDYNSLYALGYFWNINENRNKALGYFNRSLDLDSNYAPTHYNLAYLYLEIDSLHDALYHSYQAYELYNYLEYKNDAGQMAGSILGKLNRHSEAISLLLDCDKLIPNTYNTYFYLLNSFLATERVVESQITAMNMFNLDWKSHTINTDIIKLFVQNKQLAALEQFYKDRLAEDAYDKEYSGYIYLHLAQAYQMSNNTEKANINISLARESFSICYDSGHPVFTVLEKMEQ